MKAVVHSSYGSPDVLSLAEVPRPQPAPDQVLIKVHATTVNRTDCGFRQGKPRVVRLYGGLLRPKHQILGTEVAGVVEEVGQAVREFSPGDRVFGVNADHFGAHAEYLCMSESAPLALMPPDLSFTDAASVPDGAVLALAFLDRLELPPGHRVLIYGASGSIGTAAVQLAKQRGAEVTAVCDTKHVELVASLGADTVIDYTKQEFIRSGDDFDAVFDAVGKSTYWHCRPGLKADGVYCVTDLGHMWQNPALMLATFPSRGRKVTIPFPRYNKAAVRLVKELLESGDYAPVVDRCYSLDDVVEATRYVETEQKTGNVVLTVVP